MRVQLLILLPMGLFRQRRDVRAEGGIVPRGGRPTKRSHLNPRPKHLGFSDWAIVRAREGIKLSDLHVLSNGRTNPRLF